MICKLIDDVGLAQISGALKELKLTKEKYAMKIAETIENAIESGDELFDEDMDLLLDGQVQLRDDPLLEEEPEKLNEVNRLIKMLEKKQY